jgi:N-acetylglucosaminyl-diphospho-decaprenol L-rhamnosyltransferase
MAAPSQRPDAPRCAVVTVSYGSESVLPEFLDSVSRASAENPLTVVVVDNKPGSSTAVRDLATARGASYLPLDSNRGYGAAMNAGVSSLPASVEWLLISNPDVILSEGAIDSLIEVGDSDPTIGAVGPAILTSDGDVYPSARAIPSLRHGIGHALFANLWVNNPWTRAYRNDADDAVVFRDAGWLSGSCLLVRRGAFTALGGFDEGYFMYFEDVDLGFRLGKAGFRNVYDPSTSAIHSGAHSTETDSSAMVVAHHNSAKRFVDRKYPGVLLWPVRTAVTIGLSIRSRLEQRRARSGG